MTESAEMLNRCMIPSTLIASPCTEEGDDGCGAFVKVERSWLQSKRFGLNDGLLSSARSIRERAVVVSPIIAQALVKLPKPKLLSGSLRCEAVFQREIARWGCLCSTHTLARREATPPSPFAFGDVFSRVLNTWNAASTTSSGFVVTACRHWWRRVVAPSMVGPFSNTLHSGLLRIAVVLVPADL